MRCFRSNAAFPGGVVAAGDDLELVRAVWGAYKGFSAIRLRDMTHAEAPWIDAMAVNKAKRTMDAEISHASMKKFFTSLKSR